MNIKLSTKALQFLALSFLCAVSASAQQHGLVSDSWITNAGLAPTPSGIIVMTLNAACPSGFTQVTALNGQFLQGTLAANGDVGTTGGNATVTPSGTVSQPTFVGGSVTTSAVSAGTPSGSNGTVSFTPAGTNGTVNFIPAGTNSTVSFTPAGTNGSTTTGGTAISSTATAAIVVSTGTGNNVANNTHTHPSHTHTVPAETFTGTAGTVPAETFTGATGTVPAETFTGTAATVPAETFTGSALPTHTHTVTASGTVSQPIFTGNAIDPRPQFTKVIFCAKN